MNKTELKERFRNGAVPQQEDYWAVIDLAAERRVVEIDEEWPNGEALTVENAGGWPLVRVLKPTAQGQEEEKRVAVVYGSEQVTVTNQSGEDLGKGTLVVLN